MSKAVLHKRKRFHIKVNEHNSKHIAKENNQKRQRIMVRWHNTMKLEKENHCSQNYHHWCFSDIRVKQSFCRPKMR